MGDGLKVRRAEPVFMQVALEGNDTEGADNEMNAYAIYDRYCVPSQLPLKGPSLHSLGVFNTQKELSSSKTGAMRYALTEPQKSTGMRRM